MKRDRMVYELISLLPEADDDAIQIVHDLLEDFVASKKNLHGEKNSLYIDVLPFEYYPLTEKNSLSEEHHIFSEMFPDMHLTEEEKQFILEALNSDTHADMKGFIGGHNSPYKKRSSFYPGADEDGMIG